MDISKFTIEGSQSIIEALKKIEFTFDQWRELVAYSKQKFPFMKVFVCVYEHNSIDKIDKLDIDGFKINSSDLSNPSVLKKVARKNKPIHLSVGASTISEIQYAINEIKSLSDSPITLMYGFQSFPTKPADINLRFISTLIDYFKLPVGYQDHCDGESDSGFWLPAATIGMGVSCIEKHITDDRSRKGFDFEAALNPEEFNIFKEMIDITDLSMGSPNEREFSEEEKKYRLFQKKTIVASNHLKKGQLISGDDFSFMRASNIELQPNETEKLVGKKLNRDIEMTEIISIEDVELRDRY